MRVATDLFELELGIEAWCVQFPQGMDANEYALKRQHAESALNLALQQAQWMGLGMAPSAVFRHELGDEASAQPSSLAVQGSLPLSPVNTPQMVSYSYVVAHGCGVCGGGRKTVCPK